MEAWKSETASQWNFCIASFSAACACQRSTKPKHLYPLHIVLTIFSSESDWNEIGCIVHSGVAGIAIIFILVFCGCKRYTLMLRC